MENYNFVDFGILMVLAIALFGLIVSEVLMKQGSRGIRHMVIVLLGAVFLTLYVVNQEIKSKPIREAQELEEKRSYNKIQLVFKTIKPSEYKKYQCVVFDYSGQELKFKVLTDKLNIMTLKPDQVFNVYYEHIDGKKCSLLLERDFIDKDILSEEKVCF